jgi:hypothetical protein
MNPTHGARGPSAGQDPEVLARVLLDMRREIDAKKEQDGPPPADTATAALPLVAGTKGMS